MEKLPSNIKRSLSEQLQQTTNLPTRKAQKVDDRSGSHLEDTPMFSGYDRHMVIAHGLPRILDR